MRSPKRLALLTACALALALPTGAQAGFATTATPLTDPIDGISNIAARVDPAGNSFVVWQEILGTAPPFTNLIAGRRVAADGSLGPRLLLSDPGVKSFNPAMAVGADGRSFVAWETVGLPNSVVGRWVEPDGTVGPLLTLLDGNLTTEDGAGVHVVVNDDGRATVAWQNQAAGHRIEARDAYPDSARGPQMNSPMNADVNAFDMAALPGGSEFFVAGSNTNVLDSLGNFSTPVNAKMTGSVSTLHTGIAFDTHGNGLIAWRRGNMAPMAIIARRIGPDGQPIGSEIVVEPDTSDFVGADQQVAVDSSGHFIVGFDLQDVVNDGHSYVRAVNADGSLPDIAHAVSPVGHSEPVVTLDDAGTGIAAFSFRAPGAMQSAPFAQLLGAGAAPFGDLTPLSSSGAGGGTTLANDPPTGVATLVWLELSGGKEVLFERRYMRPPTCVDSSATVIQGRPVDAPLSCTGIGVNGAKVVTAPAHGKLGAVSKSGPSIQYTPTPGYQGPDSFVVEGQNDGGTSNDVTVRIAVNRDTIRPSITTFKLRRTRVRKTTSTAAAKRKIRARYRYSLVLKVSEASTVKVAFARAVRGVKKGRRCRVARRGTHGRRCTAYKTVGSVSSKQLADSVTLPVARRFVKPGRLRIRATATDAAGNKSKPRTVKARLKR